jgi:hypothetical protein
VMSRIRSTARQSPVPVSLDSHISKRDDGS